MYRIKFMNTEIDNLTMKQALKKISSLVEENKNAYIVTPNVDHIVRLESDRELKQVYDQADLIIADGKPLLWISRWYKTPIIEKISGSDLFPELCKMAAEKKYSMFFLGAAEGVAAKAADKLMKKFPGLEVAGTYSPPFGFEKDKQEVEKIINMLRKAHPHILIVGLGCPKQEKFIYHYREQYQIPVSLGLGASLDFEAGIIKRAPEWMQKCGLEWFFRIGQEPGRMTERYMTDAKKIIGLVRKYK